MEDARTTPLAAVARRLAGLGLGIPELRFFATCYACALIGFLVMLS